MSWPASVFQCSACPPGETDENRANTVLWNRTAKFFPYFPGEGRHPRATATQETTMGLGHCAASAAVGTAGRHRVLRRVVMPATWPSTPMGSSRKPQQAVRSVFSCVASRNRGPSGTRTAPVRVFYWPTGRKIQPRKPRPSRAERHRASRAGRRRPERPKVAVVQLADTRLAFAGTA